MRYAIPLAALMAVAGACQAAGLLIPEDKKLPPLAMVNHKVNVAIVDQVATTTVEQTFRNHTDRNLEATYVFPVPRGASVDRFTMWVDGKETSGELLDAKKASQVYTDIVRRTQDPGLLEYLGNDLMRLRVFPVPPKSDQKVKLSFKSISRKDGAVVEYIYPLKTNGRGTQTLEEFAVKISIQSQQPIQNVYSPTHAIDVKRQSEREVSIDFERNQALLDKDFQVFYGTGDSDIGLTPLLYKPITAEDGYFMMLVSPQIDAEKVRTPRDLVLVLDTSSSMSELKIQQAKKAVKFCLSQLGERDRFGIIKFSTTVTRFRDNLVDANKDFIERAEKWVDDIRPSGGTAIWPALDEALQMRPNDPARPFTVVFFTDGQPTVDDTNPDSIVKKVTAKNSGNTRIFTFGVGDDVNAAMLDQLADRTRAVSTYVRPAEDIGTKVASLYGKISHPIMTDLRLVTNDNVKLHEVYPPKLPDLFQGSQLVAIGRYTGSGHTAVRLTGMVAGEAKQFVYELNFPVKTDAATGRDFVEPLWARRKVGYLLDQIRVNGEQKELIDEVVALAKRYGIATPYTSYLVVPDGPMPVAQQSGMPRRAIPMPAPGIPGGPVGGFGGIGGIGGGRPYAAVPSGLMPPGSGDMRAKSPTPVTEYAKNQVAGRPAADGEKGAQLFANRGRMYETQIREAEEALKKVADPADRARLLTELDRLSEQKKTFDEANRAFKGAKDGYQTGRLGVDLAVNSRDLRTQDKLSLTANRQVNGRQVLEIGGVWIDDQFKADTPTLVVKSQSNAYFRILEKQPAMKEVFRLGNHLVWLAPNGTALVIDQNDGKEELEDKAIEALFVAKK